MLCIKFQQYYKILQALFDVKTLVSCFIKLYKIL